MDSEVGAGDVGSRGGGAVSVDLEGLRRVFREEPGYDGIVGLWKMQDQLPAILAALERIPELEREIERLREAHRAPNAEAIHAGARLLEMMGRSPESWQEEAERWRTRSERLEAENRNLKAIIDLHDSSAHCVALEAKLAHWRQRAEQVGAALRELYESLHETEDGGLFEDFTQERWERFSAAHDLAGAALADASATQQERPTIVCLCGSTRFKDAFEEVARQETVAGRIVLTVNEFGNDGHPEKAHLRLIAPDEKARLDELHLRKIDLADEVLILNVDGYIGESTSRELAYAQRLGKRIRFLADASAEGGT
jgi:hypothetical protein